MPNEKQQKIKMSTKRKDINFFALKKVKRKGLEISIPPWVISILVPALVIAVIASIYIYNQSAINRLQNELAASELQIEHANVDKQRPYMAKKTVEKDIFATYYKWIENLNSQFVYFKNVQSEIPVKITEASAGLAQISGFTAKNGEVTIKGSSASMSNIAVFQSKCMEIKDVETAFVSDIKKESLNVLIQPENENEIYTFTLKATFKSKNNMMKEEDD